ncbi:hypothetical protein QNO00_07890 [Arthrobacter sp. zg-Y1219]|uniref:hypothetical protein n=1 Tax=Arthrobacter sp. zg-Y1219 TaxID=3049067 RepID=UPI0024C2B8E7|nr:hypothetical protein [Arthrobacter sp. zg-Y1219]MDK1360188.1 hypothetical protein [Arthrobacter sp. zg-Y1219]
MAAGRNDDSDERDALSVDIENTDMTLANVFAQSNRHSLVYRVFRLVRVRFVMLILMIRNRFGKSAVTGNASAVVSLTTFGSRLNSVFYTIESIASGVERPKRLLLWLDDETEGSPLPSSLLRLRKRGLEIRYTTDFRSHKKYFPYVMSDDCDSSIPLVTADDDILYPKHWLSGLVSAFESDPNSIWAYRAHTIRLNDDGIMPYLEWEPCRSSNPSFRSFATGVSGVIYPPKMQDELRKAGDEFLQYAARADDVWLHAVAVRSQIRVRQVGAISMHFDIVRGSWEGGLVTSNLSGGNDEQIRNTYRADDVSVIREGPAEP